MSGDPVLVDLSELRPGEWAQAHGRRIIIQTDDGSCAGGDTVPQAQRRLDEDREAYARVRGEA